MSRDAPEALEQRTLDARSIAAQFPPKLVDPNKAVLYAAVLNDATRHEGSIALSRWPSRSLAGLELPSTSATRVEASPTPLAYPPSDHRCTHWTLNFSGRSAFYAYGAAAFAQDEQQVAEHPVLASIREAFVAEGRDLVTRDETGAPTPVLLHGVQRHARITDPALYGRRFAHASPDSIRQAVTPIVPATRSNIIAVEAPSARTEPDAEDAIKYALRAATTAFTAATRVTNGQAIVHTGFWGCGAYGGDRVLMTMVQIAAARASAIEHIVFHVLDEAGVRDATRAIAALDAAIEVLVSDERSVAMTDLASVLAQMGFDWGDGDGN